MATPKQTDPQFKLRLTPELKREIDASAAKNNRSINAEIIHRLELSFAMDTSEDELRVGYWEMPEGIDSDDISAAIDEATRQATAYALKKLGVVQRPLTVGGKNETAPKK